MNISDEAVEAIRADLVKGWTVCAEVPSRALAREVFEAVAERVGDDAARISRVSGRESVTTYIGGEFRVSTNAQGSPYDMRVTLK